MPTPFMCHECDGYTMNIKGVCDSCMTKEEDREIRCKCGKFWGLPYFKIKKECGRCRTTVKARGKLGEN